MTKLCAACHQPMIARSITHEGHDMAFLGCCSDAEECDQSIQNALPPVDFIKTYFTQEAQLRLLPLLAVGEAIFEVTD